MGTYLEIPKSSDRSNSIKFKLCKWETSESSQWLIVKAIIKREKEILIKSVDLALPTHIMSCFKLFQSLISKLTSAIFNFWWISNGCNCGLHLTAWDNLCKPKTEGGLGFHSMKNFNKALLAKHIWRLYQYSNSLVARVLKWWYYRNLHLLRAKKMHSPSFGWKRIFSSRDLLIRENRIKFGLGENISVWNDS